MSETTNPASAETSFAELFQSTTEAVKEGEIAQGKVLAIDDDYVTVDVGFKSEGQVQTWEFMDDDGTIQIAVGDTVDVERRAYRAPVRRVIERHQVLLGGSESMRRCRH